MFDFETEHYRQRQGAWNDLLILVKTAVNAVAVLRCCVWDGCLLAHRAPVDALIASGQSIQGSQFGQT